MRIAIWQQFSSNHSNNFVLIGRFDSVEAAENAYQITSALFTQLIPVLREQHRSDQWDGVTPHEQEIALFLPYGVIPQKTLDWLAHPLISEEQIGEYLRFYDQSLYLTDVYQGNQGGESFKALFEQLGAKTAYAENATQRDVLAVDLDCTAPDMPTAERIEAGLRSEIDTPLPWLGYSSGKSTADEAVLREQEQRYLVWQNWETHLRTLEGKFIKTPRWARPELQKVIDAHKQNPPTLPRLENHKDYQWKHRWMRFSSDYVRISREGTELRCRNIVFTHYYNLPQALPAILEWIRAHGCEVAYQFNRLRTQYHVTAHVRDEHHAQQVIDTLIATRSGNSNESYFRLGDQALVNVDNTLLMVTVLHDDSTHIGDVESFLQVQKCKKIQIEYLPVE